MPACMTQSGAAQVPQHDQLPLTAEAPQHELPLALPPEIVCLVMDAAETRDKVRMNAVSKDMRQHFVANWRAILAEAM